MKKEDKTLEKYKGYIGETFNRLTIVDVKRDEKKGVVCRCKCSCNNEIINRWIKAVSVTSGNTKSCGCLNKERIIRYNKESGANKTKINKYDVSGKYGIGWTTNTEREFYFDLIDYDKIKYYAWLEHKTKGGYAALETTDKETGKQVRFHYLLGKKGWDHINRNPFDNRASNLRECNKRENNLNHNIRKDNSSGVTGVNYVKASKKWQARISIGDGKRKSLGYFDTYEEAVEARIKAEKEHYGEWSPLYKKEECC